MKRRIVLSLAWALVLGVAAVSRGAVLGEWELTANGAGVTDESGKVTVGNFTGGSGIGSITYGVNGGYANSWTPNNVVDLTDYFEVSLTPNAGHGLMISQIDFGEYRSGTGPLAYVVRASLNNFATYDQLASGDIPDNTSIRSHSIPDLNIVVSDGQTFKVRFYGYKAKGSGGNWRIQANTLKIYGEAVSTAEPPAITFRPGTGVQVHVSNLLEVAVSLFPMGGSGISSWSFDPGAAGPASFSNSVFYFRPAAADEGQTYALAVTATNQYGSVSKSLDILVTEYLPEGSLEVTFDNANEVKTGSAAEVVNLSGTPWLLDQVIIGEAANDPKNGLRSGRFGTFFPPSMTSQDKLLPGMGVGLISFQHAMYHEPEEPRTGSTLVVEVAETLEGNAWFEVGRVSARADALTYYEVPVGINTALHVRIRLDLGSGDSRVNVDNVTIAPYVAPDWTAYEEFLLQYNVTPGDPGTEPDDDLDGDGFTNDEEFQAGTNPYDATVHP
ncbi:MAG: hypothetical protein GX803_04230 [Lentisphaerae bacterium]|jgi:hypothetical protein|nr:hypothetical protein [Lentisphaerota bacterium]